MRMHERRGERMSYALFLGCTIPVRSQNYELSARAVAEVLGLEMTDLEGFACCGYPVKSTDSNAGLIFAARNLAIAEKEGKDILTLCNACTGTLMEAKHELDEHDELRQEINKDLAKMGLEYNGGIKIRHFSRVLYEDVGPDKLREAVTRDMSGFRFSAHYGCHYIRPRDLYDGFDDPENPTSLEKLIEITGAEAVDYRNKLECCGGAILGADENIALQMAKKKLDVLSGKEVDALITGCPFCSVMYEDNQKKIESNFDVEYNLPVLFYPQLLGLALGLDKKQLGFRLNKVKAKALLAKLEG